ncbi:hypothetical protein CRG98_004574 [Punica granatum]|uniref:Uncharacterized protein n=1 Tax=Punica granatum TaxID=22663 RepID=A0A2I0L3A0_PUNGR|nr:hypothetical protein CRG98_004574 [Punica granatum]
MPHKHTKHEQCFRLSLGSHTDTSNDFRVTKRVYPSSKMSFPSFRVKIGLSGEQKTCHLPVRPDTRCLRAHVSTLLPPVRAPALVTVRPGAPDIFPHACMHVYARTRPRACQRSPVRTPACPCACHRMPDSLPCPYTFPPHA